jgi:hypothetical protein
VPMFGRRAGSEPWAVLVGVLLLAIVVGTIAAAVMHTSAWPKSDDEGAVTHHLDQVRADLASARMSEHVDLRLRVEGCRPGDSGGVVEPEVSGEFGPRPGSRHALASMTDQVARALVTKGWHVGSMDRFGDRSLSKEVRGIQVQGYMWPGGLWVRKPTTHACDVGAPDSALGLVVIPAIFVLPGAGLRFVALRRPPSRGAFRGRAARCVRWLANLVLLFGGLVVLAVFLVP